VLRAHHVQRAVRLHVLHPDTLGSGERLEGSHLVEHVILQLVGRDGHCAPTEAHEVGQRDVGADRDSVLARHTHGGAHDVWVAAVVAARYVGGGEQRHQLGVRAERPPPVALPHVGVDVHPECFHRVPSTRCTAAVSSRSSASASRTASSTLTSRKRTVSRPGTSCPTIHVDASTSVAAQMKPPSVGPSAVRMMGWLPHTLTPHTGYPLSRMLDGCPPATPPLVRAQR